MQRTLIIVADRTKARIFQYQGVGKDFLPIHTLEHPEGRLKNKDIDSDAPGKSFSSFGQGSHDMPRENSAKEKEDQRFAADIAKYLDQKRKTDGLQRLFMAAEGGFLGLIKGAMDKDTLAIVKNTLSKDYGKIPDSEITSKFKDILPVS